MENQNNKKEEWDFSFKRDVLLSPGLIIFSTAISSYMFYYNSKANEYTEKQNDIYYEKLLKKREDFLSESENRIKQDFEYCFFHSAPTPNLREECEAEAIENEEILKNYWHKNNNRFFYREE